jgi:hypothetical protein
MSVESRDLGAILRHKLATGELPKGEQAKLTLNLGLISPCAACGSLITGMECIAEFHDGRKLRFHALCLEAWHLERRAGGDQAQFVIPQPDWEGNDLEAVGGDVVCAACGLRIPPFDGRYRARNDSYHPECYGEMQRTGAGTKTSSV